LGVRVAVPDALPSGFLLSLAYDCWAFRRLGVTLDARSGAITSWLYREGDAPSQPMLTPEEAAAGFPATGREITLSAPISDQQIRALRVGEVVLLSGAFFPGRDAVHSYRMKPDPPADLAVGVPTP